MDSVVPLARTPDTTSLGQSTRVGNKDPEIQPPQSPPPCPQAPPNEHVGSPGFLVPEHLLLRFPVFPQRYQLRMRKEKSYCASSKEKEKEKRGRQKAQKRSRHDNDEGVVSEGAPQPLT